MYCRPLLVYEVGLFRTHSSPERITIPNLTQYAAGLQSPAPKQLKEGYLSPQEVQDWYARLIRFITQKEDPGFTYTASIRWIKKGLSDLPDHWQFSAEGSSPS